VKANKQVRREYFYGHIATPKTQMIHQELEDSKERNKFITLMK